jgi:hypothetical protein
LLLLIDLVEKVGFVVGANADAALDDNNARITLLNFMLMFYCALIVCVRNSKDALIKGYLSILD